MREDRSWRNVRRFILKNQVADGGWAETDVNRLGVKGAGRLRFWIAKSKDGSITKGTVIGSTPVPASTGSLFLTLKGYTNCAALCPCFP